MSDDEILARARAKRRQHHRQHAQADSTDPRESARPAPPRRDRGSTSRSRARPPRHPARLPRDETSAPRAAAGACPAPAARARRSRRATASPLSATSARPSRRAGASRVPPYSSPKSSASSAPSSAPAHATSMNGLSARSLIACIAYAICPFAVPCSPSRSTVVRSLEVSSSIWCASSRIAGDVPSSAPTPLIPRRSRM